MLKEKEIDLAKDVLSRLDRTLPIEVDAGSEPADPFAQNLRGVVETLAEASGHRLELVSVDEAEKRSAPSLRIGNVRYRAAPEGPELAPFLDFILARGRSEAESTVGEPIGAADLQLFIAAACPNCPRVAADCLRLAAEHPRVSLSIVDAQQYPELAGTCRSVPMLIIDGVYTVVGQTSRAELLAILRRRDDPDAFERALGAMIDAGRHREASRELARPEGLSALPGLLAKSTLQQRMGLMMTVEEALGADFAALDGAVPLLLPLATVDDATLRGDLADLLGQIGEPSARSTLEALARDENADVCEIAEESLTMLRG